MISKVLKIFKQDYQTLNLIEVSKSNLIANFKYLSSLNKKIKIAPVVKSNGYGHGIIKIAKILDQLNPPYFCVDSLYEAYELQKVKIKTKILIMGYTNPENFKVKKLPFSFAIFDLKTAKILNDFQKGCDVHIFVDTGMHREGVSIDDLPNFLKVMKQFSNLTIEGLMSHLASSGGKNDPLFNLQIKNFKKALDIFKKYKIQPKWVHIAASGGLINKETNKIISQVSNLSRAGISLYGLGDDKHLKPALKLITHLGQIKILRKGETTGYDGTYRAKKDLNIGILPIGYFDGVDRGLSNKGIVKIREIECPIIGRVSMNLTTVDLSKIENPKPGEQVLVYSDHPQDKNSVANVAKLCHRIPYEILVNLAESMKRIIV